MKRDVPWSMCSYEHVLQGCLELADDSTLTMSPYKHIVNKYYRTVSDIQVSFTFQRTLRTKYWITNCERSCPKSR